MWFHWTRPKIWLFHSGNCNLGRFSNCILSHTLPQNCKDWHILLLQSYVYLLSINRALCLKHLVASLTQTIYSINLDDTIWKSYCVAVVASMFSHTNFYSWINTSTENRVIAKVLSEYDKRLCIQPITSRHNTTSLNHSQSKHNR